MKQRYKHKPINEWEQWDHEEWFHDQEKPTMNTDDINVRLQVTASFIVTVGLYEEGVTLSAVAQNVDDILRKAGGIEDFIDRVDIHELTKNNGTIIVSSTDA